MKGSTIRHKLAQVRMSQSELARLLKVSPQTVHKIMNTENIQTGTLERICNVMHLPISFFYDGNLPQHEGEEPEEWTASIKDIEKEVDDKASKIWETTRLSDKVWSLLKSQHKRMGSLCQYVGITAAGMHNVFERNSCKVDILLKMAEFFDVPPAYFLPEDKRAQGESEKDREIQYLKEQVKAYKTALASVLSSIKTPEIPQPAPSLPVY